MKRTLLDYGVIDRVSFQYMSPCEDYPTISCSKLVDLLGSFNFEFSFSVNYSSNHFDILNFDENRILEENPHISIGLYGFGIWSVEPLTNLDRSNIISKFSPELTVTCDHLNSSQSGKISNGKFYPNAYYSFFKAKKG